MKGPPCKGGYGKDGGYGGYGKDGGWGKKGGYGKGSMKDAFYAFGPAAFMGCGGFGPYDSYGCGKGKGKKGKDKSYSKAYSSWSGKTANTPEVSFISLAEDSTITAQGLPAEAPVVTYEKAVEIFQSVVHILHDLAGEKVEIVHDADWKLYPEVANAAALAGVEENCVAVAFCKEQGKWGVGMGSNWKAREASSKMALCIALAPDNPCLPGLCRHYPDFAATLDAAYEAHGMARPTKPSSASKAVWEDELKPPVVHWVTLEEESSATGQGMPAKAPAIIFDKNQSVFGKGHNVLSDLVDDVAKDVVFTHDAEWTKHPEIGSALKQTPGCEEQCFCVARCEKLGKWAMGLAPGWKHRETAAKLALAVAICAEGGPALDTVAANYKQFGELCASAGFSPSAAVMKPPATTRGKPGLGNGLGLGEQVVAAAQAVPGRLLPANSPFWLRLASPPALLIASMPTETLLIHEDGNRKRLYGHADQILAEMIPGAETNVECVDDAMWEKFPEVVAALEGYNIQDSCLHVAVYGAANIWACGVGSKWKTRSAAAKIALATVLALRAIDAGQGPDLSKHPEFGAFLNEAAQSAM